MNTIQPGDELRKKIEEEAKKTVSSDVLEEIVQIIYPIESPPHEERPTTEQRARAFLAEAVLGALRRQTAWESSDSPQSGEPHSDEKESSAY